MTRAAKKKAAKKKAARRPAKKAAEKPPEANGMLSPSERVAIALAELNAMMKKHGTTIAVTPDGTPTCEPAGVGRFLIELPPMRISVVPNQEG